MCRIWALLPLLFGPVAYLPADGPGDNVVDKVRPIPPAGIQVDQASREALREKVDELGKAIAALPAALKGKPALLDLLPDVEVYHRAVRDALDHNEFYTPAEVKAALNVLLPEGNKRAAELKAGKPSWTTATGLVVRGYRSKIDGSAQPYGLVVPASFKAGMPTNHRLDIWMHGRGEKLTELAFVSERMRAPGAFVPAHAFVLHPYGRYCNAFKFAGEVDVLEALAHAKKHYPIDNDRVVLRGFSMGGAGCWQMAVHYPDLWAAAAPGAGFSETKEFLRVFQNEAVKPTEFEQKLWHMFDCPDYAVNLFNLPVVAYSGEKDRQKQAADEMAKALQAKGLDLVHIIGPGAGHNYEPRAKAEVDRRIDRLAAIGRERVPARVRFVTYTLRYPRSFWVTVDGLTRHWEAGEVTAAFVNDQKAIQVETSGVTGLTLSFGPGEAPLPFAANPAVTIDGHKLKVGPCKSDRSWSASFSKGRDGWALADKAAQGLHKVPGLQGPIDDAFLDSFLMVRPTGTPMHQATGDWAKREMAHAVSHWRSQFRGAARVKDDGEVSDADIAAHNLVLWGDPSSNKVLARVLEKLPLEWTSKQVKFAGKEYAAANHVPVLVYPNPLNPKKYVVLNSGFTFREYDYLNNARQVSKLPDYAIMDVRTPANARFPAKVVTGGFFDETWQVK